jgi:UDP-N-acetylmuramate: L-alanyl-gamma-D-glutamyl-meso-diaminopimelate ligase
VVYKDFAHSPSKVKATTEAVKSQYPNRPLVACLELHTYSSLNAAFLEHYKGTLDAADTAVVFYSPEAVEIKKLDSVTETQIETAFEREDIIVFTDPTHFKNHINSLEFVQKTVLLMSSGSYGSLDFETLKTKVSGSS